MKQRVLLIILGTVATVGALAVYFEHYPADPHTV
jgi:hypothetical protein